MLIKKSATVVATGWSSFVEFLFPLSAQQPGRLEHHLRREAQPLGTDSHNMSTTGRQKGESTYR